MGKNHDKVRYKDGVYYYRDGWKQKIGDITKVYVKGTDYERGLQLGKLLSGEVKLAYKSYLSYLIFRRIEGPCFLKRLIKKALFFIKPLLFLLYRKKVEQGIKKYPPWIIELMEGVGRGAGIHPFYLKFIGLPESGDVLGNDRFNYQEMKSCCSFAFTGEDGNIYHGKNLDWIKVEEHIDLLCFQQHEDENGDSFSVIGVPGFLTGYEFGMNSHGISIGLTGRFHRGKRASKLAFTNALELSLLRYGKNLKQIQRMYNTKTGFDRTDGLLISSQHDGDYQLFEVNPMGAAITSSQYGVHWTVNTYIHPKLQKYNKNWGTIYDNQFCDPRYIRLKELLNQNPQTREDAFKILSDTLQPGFESKTFLGQASINRFISHASALMVRGKQCEVEGVWIAKAPAYAASHEYSFFDFSSTPSRTHKIRPADPMVKTEAFNNFKGFMKVRESRYYVSRGKLLANAVKLVEKEPGNPVFILFLAQNYTWHKLPDRALTVLNRHPLPWCADYWYCLGQCYIQTGQYEEAKTSFTKAMTLPSIDGFAQAVRLVCLVQLVKVNTSLKLTHEVDRLQKEIKEMQAKFATPNIGMPDYPYINNIIEQMEEVVM